jgi:hypothetical protein
VRGLPPDLLLMLENNSPAKERDGPVWFAENEKLRQFSPAAALRLQTYSVAPQRLDPKRADREWSQERLLRR